MNDVISKSPVTTLSMTLILVVSLVFFNKAVAESSDSSPAMDHSMHQIDVEGEDDPHAGHIMPSTIADPHAGHDMGAMDMPGHMDHMGHGSDHNMEMDDQGMVMNTNSDTLPKDCAKISEDVELVVYAGTKYAMPFPATVFGMDKHDFSVPPCSRVHITFINEDQIRHQFMIHGLPKYLYPQGMFHLEAAGGATKKGTLIVGSDARTFLAHCDIAQHMEKGMKAQFRVGEGDGDLPSVPGISGSVYVDSYESVEMRLLASLVALAGFVVIVLLGQAWLRR